MKLLFTDLDGTLLNNDSQVAPDTKAFLDEFLLAGNKLILSSARRDFNMQQRYAGV